MSSKTIIFCCLVISLLFVSCGHQSETENTDLQLNIRFATSSQAQHDSDGLPADVQSYRVQARLGAVDGVPMGDTGCVAVTEPDQYELFSFGGPGHIDHACAECVFGHMYALSQTLTVAPLLRAGDADQDLDFDQRDLVQVLTAGKYLTAEPATWGEGDWNGGPGGYPGGPPPRLACMKPRPGS